MLSKSIAIERSQFKNLSEIFVLIWGMMIAIPLPSLPKSGRLKIFVSLWALFCLHWYSAYTTSLYSNLTQMKSENEVCIVHLYY